MRKDKVNFLKFVKYQEVARTAMQLNECNVTRAIEWLERDHARHVAETPQQAFSVRGAKPTTPVALVILEGAISFLNANPTWDMKVGYDLIPGGIKQ